MQREGGVLMRGAKMRNGFSMITAIFVIVLMATLAALILNLSGKVTKETAMQYQREQAMLLAKSYTEYAVLAVTANEQNSSNCLDDIQGSYGIYTVDVNLSYLGTPATLPTGSSCARILDNNITEVKTPLSIIVDVFVRYPDPDHPNDLNITYHKRTLQKI